jgi:large repetitive protein
MGSPATQAFTLTVDQAPAFVSARRATFRPGHHRTFTIGATGFPAPRLSERGHLPKGVRFTARSNGTAVLTGDAARADKGKTYTITIFARNGVGPAIRQTFRLTVS